MNAVLGDFVRIARVTTVQRDANAARMMKVITALMLIAGLVQLGIALVNHTLDADSVARGALALGGFWLAIVWATIYVPGAVLLNSPVNARLLPRQRRRLMQMTAAGWLACTLAFAAVFENWATIPLCGLYLLALPLMLTGHRQFAPLVFLACAWPMLSNSVLPPALVAFIVSPASIAVLSVLLLAAGAWGLRLMYPAGGDAYMDRRADVLKRIQRPVIRGSNDAAALAAPGGKLVHRVYVLALRRDSRRADPARMLMHALGPVGHWSAWLGVSVWLMAAGILLAVLAWWGQGPLMERIMRGAGVAGLIPLSVLTAFCTAQFGQQMRRSRGEQALLRLTPLAGDGALLNRRLAGGLLKGALGNWGMVTAAILLATLLVGGGADTLLRQLALCCLGGQVALMGVLGDYADDAGWNLMLALRAGMLAALEASAAFGLGWLAGPSAWPWMIAIALGGAVLQLRLGWRRMLAAPAAFPSGRLA